VARLHRDILRILTAEIVVGDLPAGSMLPRELDLAERFGVSRGVTRETIRAMEERGLISVRHGKGATINRPDHWDVLQPDVLAAMLDSDHAHAALSQYLECRRILEPGAAASAAAHAGSTDVGQLAAAVADMRTVADERATRVTQMRFHEAELAFHRALLTATGNQVLAALVERLHSAQHLVQPPLEGHRHRARQTMLEHERILEAIRAGEPDGARQAMDAHLDSVGEFLASVLSPSPG
jgi:DNA-binding FadR family transcriptional regulator